ncbi:MAG: hypothetical protein PHX51_05935, partial [Clostridia bacterium]|nr:hypothetical protein [Clostridia bacterium]
MKEIIKEIEDTAFVKRYKLSDQTERVVIYGDSSDNKTKSNVISVTPKSFTQVRDDDDTTTGNAVAVGAVGSRRYRAWFEVPAINKTSIGLSPYDTITSVRIVLQKSSGALGTLELHGASQTPIYACTDEVIDLLEVDGLGYKADITDMYFASNQTRYYILTTQTESETNNFYVCTETAGFMTKPRLEIDYIPAKDEPDYQKYIEGSLSKSSYKVNVRNGRASHNRPLFSMSGELMPVSLSLSYEDFEVANTEYSVISTYLPAGWKLNYQQYIVSVSGGYAYFDGENVRHLFVSAVNNTSSDTIYIDNNGSGLTLSFDSVANAATISDIKENILTFAATGTYYTLSSISDIYDVATQISYVTNADESVSMTITDGMSNSTVVVFANSGMTIKKPFESTATITMALDQSGNMIITDSDGIKSKYEMSSGYLNKAYDYVLVNSEEEVTDYMMYTRATENRVSFIRNKYGDNFVSTHSLNYGRYKTIDMNERYVHYTYHFDYAGGLVKEYESTYSGSNETIYGATARRIRDYETYKGSLLNNKYVDVAFSDNVVTGTETTAASKTVSFSGTDIQFKSLDNTGYYLLSAEVKLFEAASEKSVTNRETYLKLFITDLSGEETQNVLLHFDPDIRDKQLCSVKFKLGMDVDSITTVSYTAYHNFNVGTATFTGIRLTNDVAGKKNLCVNQAFQAADAADYVETKTEDNITTLVNWYKLTDDVDFTYEDANGVTQSLEGTSHKLLESDIAMNLVNCFRKSTGSGDTLTFDFWTNGGRNMVHNARNVRFKKDTNSIRYVDALVSSVIDAESYVSYNYLMAHSPLYYIQNTTNVNITVGTVTTGSISTAQYNSNYEKTYECNYEGVRRSYLYNTKGSMTQNKLYNSSSSNTDITYNTEYSVDNRFKTAEKEYIGQNTNTTQYSYSATTSNLTKVSDPTSTDTDYSYTSDNLRLSQIESESSANDFTYDSHGRVNKITHNSFDYDFTYDGFGNINKVEIAGTEAISKEYLVNQGSTRYDYTTTEFNNSTTGAKTRKVFDKYGRHIKTQVVTGTVESPVYTDMLINIYTDKTDTELSVLTQPDSSATSTSLLRKVIDNYTNTTETYTYNGASKLENVTKSGGSTDTSETEYDMHMRIEQTTLGIGTDEYVTQLAYKGGEAEPSDVVKSSLTTLNTNYLWKNEKTFDSIDRVSKVKNSMSLDAGTNSNHLITDYIFYSRRNANNTIIGSTPYVYSAAYSTQIGGSTATEVSKDVYSYDAKGNITQIVNKTGNTVNNTVSYVYDGLNRLSRENNSALNKTWTFAYDVGGNITVKTEYAYTTGTLGTPTNKISYGYDTTWKDKLTSWNGLSGTANFNYDNVGNPTKYKGNTLTWTR